MRADATAQLLVERRDKLDWQRTAAFAVYSGSTHCWVTRVLRSVLAAGVVLGCVQHQVYNVQFARLFGESQTTLTAVKKVALDATLWVPLGVLRALPRLSDHCGVRSVPANILRLSE